jgi:hypothetical protein
MPYNDFLRDVQISPTPATTHWQVKACKIEINATYEIIQSWSLIDKETKQNP